MGGLLFSEGKGGEVDQEGKDGGGGTWKKGGRGSCGG